MADNIEDIAELRAIAKEMRERKVGQHGHQSQTLVAWANRIECVITQLEIEAADAPDVIFMHNEDLTSERGNGAPSPSHSNPVYPQMLDLPPPPVATERFK